MLFPPADSPYPPPCRIEPSPLGPTQPIKTAPEAAESLRRSQDFWNKHERLTPCLITGAITYNIQTKLINLCKVAIPPVMEYTNQTYLCKYRPDFYGHNPITGTWKHRPKDNAVGTQRHLPPASDSGATWSSEGLWVKGPRAPWHACGNKQRAQLPPPPAPKLRTDAGEMGYFLKSELNFPSWTYVQITWLILNTIRKINF